MTSWNSSHGSRGCSQENLKSSGGAGLIYCFVGELTRLSVRRRGGAKSSDRVERSETHHSCRRKAMGFARAQPILRADVRETMPRPGFPGRCVAITPWPALPRLSSEQLFLGHRLVGDLRELEHIVDDLLLEDRRAERRQAACGFLR